MLLLRGAQLPIVHLVLVDPTTLFGLPMSAARWRRFERPSLRSSICERRTTARHQHLFCVRPCGGCVESRLEESRVENFGLAGSPE